MDTLVYSILASQGAVLGITAIVPEIIFLTAIWLLLRSLNAKPFYFWIYICAVLVKFSLIGFGFINAQAGGSNPLSLLVIFGLGILASMIAPICLLVISMKLRRGVSSSESEAA
jgi:hypothetical protein